MKIIAHTWNVKGNLKEVKSETEFQGELELVPMPNGNSLLLLPVSFLVAKNEFNRRVGIPEIKPLDRFDKELRCKGELTKKETFRVLKMKAGEKMSFVRYGWGREWINWIEKI